jgi:hypothetical protein
MFTTSNGEAHLVTTRKPTSSRCAENAIKLSIAAGVVFIRDEPSKETPSSSGQDFGFSSWLSQFHRRLSRGAVKQMPGGTFKARWLSAKDNVSATGQPVMITNKGRPSQK